MNRLCIVALVFMSACGGAKRVTLQDMAVSSEALTPKQLNEAIYDANGLKFGELIWQAATSKEEMEKLEAAHKESEETLKKVEKQIKALETRLPDSNSAREFYQAFLFVLEAEGKVITEIDPQVVTIVGDQELTIEEKDERITRLVENNKKAIENARQRLVRAFEQFSYKHGLEGP
jgi:chromosome segregation ATPase